MQDAWSESLGHGSAGSAQPLSTAASSQQRLHHTAGSAHGAKATGRATSKGGKNPAESARSAESAQASSSVGDATSGAYTEHIIGCRQAADGKLYTYRDFELWYGAHAPRIWHERAAKDWTDWLDYRKTDWLDPEERFKRDCAQESKEKDPETPRAARQATSLVLQDNTVVRVNF